MKTALLLTSFISLWGFIAYYLIKVGLLNSHSHSYFALKPFKKSWMFQVSLALAAFTLIPVALELTPEPIQFTAFLMLAPLLFTAIAPNFIDKGMEKDVHMKSAKAAGVFSIIWAVCVTITVHWWLIIPVIASGALMYALNRFYNRPISFLEYFTFLYVPIIMLLMIINK